MFYSKNLENVWLSMNIGALHLLDGYTHYNGTKLRADGISWDPYVIVFIDNAEAYRTKIYSNKQIGWTFLNEKFRKKIKKTAEIRLELWQSYAHQTIFRPPDIQLFNETYTIANLPNRIPTYPKIYYYYLYFDFVLLDDYEIVFAERLKKKLRPNQK